MEHFQMVFGTAFLLSFTNGIPITQYDPYLFYGSASDYSGYYPYNLPEYTDLPMRSIIPGFSRLREWYNNYSKSNNKNSTKISNPTIEEPQPKFRYANEPRSLPMNSDLNSIYNYSPEYNKLMSAMLSYYYPNEVEGLYQQHPKHDVFRTSDLGSYDASSDYDSVGITDGNIYKTLPQEQKKIVSSLRNNEKTASEEIDYYYDDSNSDLGEAAPSRRTFGMLIPMLETGMKMVGQDLGLRSSENSPEIEAEVTRNRKTHASLEAFRSAQEQAVMDSLRTQISLENIRSEAVQESLKNRQEIDKLKMQLDQQKDQLEKDRTEKEDIKRRLEYESMMRVREREEFKRKLEVEVELSQREREREELQKKLKNELYANEREKDQLKFKIDMDSALKQVNSNMETVESLNALRIKTATDAYVAAKNQKTIDDYRMAGMGYSLLNYPPTL